MLARIKVAVLPLSRNEKLDPKAREVFDPLKSEWMCDYDDAGSIGRRYRRQEEGIANHTDFDLKAHEKVSGEVLTYFDQENDKRFHPYVIEPAAGVDRATLAFLIDAYREEEAPSAKGGTEKRVYLALHKDLAPIKVAVLPLSRNEKLVPKAREVFDLLKSKWMCDYDDAGSIGRRYRRQDEVGTPFCVTVDFDTLDDNAVTVRDRDSMDQERLPIDKLKPHLEERL